VIEWEVDSFTKRFDIVLVAGADDETSPLTLQMPHQFGGLGEQEDVLG